VTDVWVANDDGTEIVRARDIAVANLDYNGNVKVRLAGADGAVVTLVAHRAHHEEHRPGDLHRQLIGVMAELSDAAGAFLVRAVHDEARGWQWVPSRCNGERRGRILVVMKPARAATRRPLPTSPFGAAAPASPAEQFAEQDQVTHDKYGLGRVVSIQDGATLVIDFGARRVRITMPCAKLAKL